MLSLALGLVAALAWGVHDFCVRYIAQHGGILPLLATVLVAGTIILTPISLTLGDWSAMTQAGFGYSILGGIVYLLGCIGLYNAFAIGPVRLVAPIIGAYPILSITWAGISGQTVPWDQWLAVGAVIAWASQSLGFYRNQTKAKPQLHQQSAGLCWAEQASPAPLQLATLQPKQGMNYPLFSSAVWPQLSAC